MPVDLNIRDYIAAAVIVVLASFLVWFAVHERGIEHAKDAAADARVAQAQLVHNTEVEARAKTLSDTAIAQFKATELQPVMVPSSLTRLVCYAPRSGGLPDHGAAAAGGNGTPSLPTESDGPPFNPAPALIADGRDADAQITLLQDTIRSYQAAGVVKK